MAEETRARLQLCPTRIDGVQALLAHKVTHAQCQERQRGSYHKCFTCTFNNAYATQRARPAALAAEAVTTRSKAG